eukprot:3280627-Pleurochrysis_carterae.AAC.1
MASASPCSTVHSEASVEELPSPMSIASPQSAPAVDDAAASAAAVANIRPTPRVKLLLRYPLVPYHLPRISRLLPASPTKASSSLLV